MRLCNHVWTVSLSGDGCVHDVMEFMKFWRHNMDLLLLKYRIFYWVVLQHLSRMCSVCDNNHKALILHFLVLHFNHRLLWVSSSQQTFRCVLCLWTHAMIVSPHPQSGKCSSPHGRTFLMTMSHSFRSKTAISTQVMVDVNATLCSRILQQPPMGNS